MSHRSSTKEKIVHLLKKENNLTVSQLASSLSITEMAVRKHLNTLDRDSFIYVNEIRQPMGRPIQVFSLTPKAEELFPKNYSQLTLEFLTDLQDLQDEKVIDLLFEKRSNRLKSEYLHHLNHKQPEEKMDELTKIQNTKGYMAEVNKIDENTFELTEYNCPIHEVAQNYKQACHCETSLFKNVLGTDDVKRTTCKADHDDHCRFLIKFKKDVLA